MNNHKTTSQAIYQATQQAQNILLISHQKPDGDTLGSNLALFEYLKQQNKNVKSFCLDVLPSNFTFIPSSQELSNDHKLFTKQYDLVITVDCANLKYAGVDKLISALPQGYTLINIDHHITNLAYANINLILHEASSTAEIIYRLLKDWKINFNKNIATALSCGIITDTDGFKNAATNYQCLSATSELIKQGAKTHQIAQNTINNIPLENLKLWGRALERLTKVNKYNLVYTWISQTDFKECALDYTATEGLANFLHILKEGEIILVLTETNQQTIKGSLRTTSDIDLTKIAALFNGGGHKKAAGFSLPGKLVCDNNKLRII